MSEERKTRNRYPCHIYENTDAKEVFDTWEGELVRDYGEYTALEDGTVLHWNHTWDEGSRILVRCNVCGGLVIRQYSVYNDMYDGPDGYYRDWVPVASVEEADLLNILWGAMELENYPFRHFRRNNKDSFWTGVGEPRPYDPEELKKKIREEYAKLKPKQKKLLEKMISEAGTTEK